MSPRKWVEIHTVKYLTPCERCGAWIEVSSKADAVKCLCRNQIAGVGKWPGYNEKGAGNGARGAHLDLKKTLASIRKKYAAISS